MDSSERMQQLNAEQRRINSLEAQQFDTSDEYIDKLRFNIKLKDIYKVQ
jgi:hypothetical protein